MSTTEMTLPQIYARGLAAVARDLGPIGYVKFVQHFMAGKGDFTRERQEWVERLTLEEILAQLNSGQEGGDQDDESAKK